ncbi:hypothetical protein BpHYR1_010501 [Brachionus plicatilis]|uniref:Uncharacterized protein n=1 Tax=Brachionus plicatilis TaxID=10195 RepID=A0A3M7SIN3_BRAPC|nr:hypothetical protein BpHYR1_010501 [Brachionus plicatilis]
MESFFQPLSSLNKKNEVASLPFRIVENRRIMDNNYSIPKRNNLSGNILNEEFDRTVIKIKSCLAKASSISIFLDL